MLVKLAPASDPDAGAFRFAAVALWFLDEKHRRMSSR
jgi:hypothetical protein